MAPQILLPHSQQSATCPYPEPDQSSLCPPCHFSKILFHIILPSTVWSFKWLLPSGFPTKPRTHLFFPPMYCMPYPSIMILWLTQSWWIECTENETDPLSSCTKVKNEGSYTSTGTLLSLSRQKHNCQIMGNTRSTAKSVSVSYVCLFYQHFALNFVT